MNMEINSRVTPEVIDKQCKRVEVVIRLLAQLGIDVVVATVVKSFLPKGSKLPKKLMFSIGAMAIASLIEDQHDKYLAGCAAEVRDMFHKIFKPLGPDDTDFPSDEIPEEA